MGQLTLGKEALLLSGGAGGSGLGVLLDELLHVGRLVHLLFLLLKLKVKLLPGGLDLGVAGHDGPAQAARNDGKKSGELVEVEGSVTSDEVDGLGEGVADLVDGVVGVQSDGALLDLREGEPDGREVHDEDGTVGGDLLDDGIEVLDDETGNVMAAPEDTLGQMDNNLFLT
jgi:hypothetical protein